ncbi:hypothetical protein Sjap_006837 [Stephania japonica]|uniref:Rubber elongation factor n=1 Tax=Stephania japonica TaxID=461633 RepID=A0AAP0PLG0_9MAGN
MHSALKLGWYLGIPNNQTIGIPGRSSDSSPLKEHIDCESVDEETEQRLKYLKFVQVAALHVVVYLSSVYDYAKNNSGPLKPGVQSVENTVKTVIGPVYHKIHDVPYQVLRFVDRKVDSSVSEVERHVPSIVKDASTQARGVASEVKRVGVVDATTKLAKTVYTKYEPAAHDLYTKYEPVAEQYAVTAWRKLNGLPLFPQVAQVVVPTAAYVSERYNQVVSHSAQRGHVAFSYLPLVPIEKIAKVFGDVMVML